VPARLGRHHPLSRTVARSTSKSADISPTCDRNADRTEVSADYGGHLKFAGDGTLELVLPPS